MNELTVLEHNSIRVMTTDQLAEAYRRMDAGQFISSRILRTTGSDSLRGSITSNLKVLISRLSRTHSKISSQLSGVAHRL
mgnify:CR=1 FL=1